MHVRPATVDDAEAIETIRIRAWQRAYRDVFPPDRWQRGVGAALLARAEAELAEAYDRAILYVLEANDRARRFYEHHGWSDDGTRGVFTRFGVDAPVARYVKELKSSASRA